MKRLFVTVLLAIALGGLASEETISIARSPMIAALPSSTTKAISNSVPFHTILYYYAGGPRGQPISNCTGRGNFTFGGCAFAGIAVPEINDLKSWSGFSNFDFPPACCGWSNPSLPQVDFETRTVLVVSPGVGHLGEKFNLTEVIMSDSHLDLKGIIPVSPLGPGGTALCFYPALVVFPVLIIDIPKTEPPATLHTTLTQGTSC